MGGLKAQVNMPQTNSAMPAPTVVRVETGQLGGAVSDGVLAFKGVPFAAAPIGDLRWRAPQPVAKWTGVRTADTFGHVCVQPKGIGRLNVSVDLPDSPAASEDCLYLNVWTAAKDPDADNRAAAARFIAMLTAPAQRDAWMSLGFEPAGAG